YFFSYSLLFRACIFYVNFFFFFSSRRRHTRWPRDWSSDVCSSDLERPEPADLDELRHDQFLSGNRNQPCTRNFLPAFRWKDRWFRPRPSAELHVLEKPCGRRSEYRRQKRLDKRAFSDDHWRNPGRLRRSLFDYGHTGLLAGGNGNGNFGQPQGLPDEQEGGKHRDSRPAEAGHEGWTGAADTCHRGSSALRPISGNPQVGLAPSLSWWSA